MIDRETEQKAKEYAEKYYSGENCKRIAYNGYLEGHKDATTRHEYDWILYPAISILGFLVGTFIVKILF